MHASTTFTMWNFMPIVFSRFLKCCGPCRSFVSLLKLFRLINIFYSLMQYLIELVAINFEAVIVDGANVYHVIRILLI